MGKAMKRMQDMFAEALADAGDNYQSNKTESSANVGEKNKRKYSLKEVTIPN